jgi:hypothetical protein
MIILLSINQSLSSANVTSHIATNMTLPKKAKGDLFIQVDYVYKLTSKSLSSVMVSSQLQTWQSEKGQRWPLITGWLYIHINVPQNLYHSPILMCCFILFTQVTETIFFIFQINEFIYDYTFCKSKANSSTTCAAELERKGTNNTT